MNIKEFKSITKFLIRIYGKLRKIEAGQEGLYELFIKHLDDAEHVSLLHRQLKDANEKIRELETALYMERKARKQ